MKTLAAGEDADCEDEEDAATGADEATDLKGKQRRLSGSNTCANDERGTVGPGPATECSRHNMGCHSTH
jgi:hypothetical protein